MIAGWVGGLEKLERYELGLAPGVKKLRGGARERSLSFIFVLIVLVSRESQSF